MLERLSSADRGSDRLAERRRLRRRRAIIALCIIIFISFASLAYELRQPATRIELVTIGDGDNTIRDIAIEAIRGDYFWLIPRDSIFFFSKSNIRNKIMSHTPNIAAVSIARNGLRSIHVQINERVPIARWCGVELIQDTHADCYVFDSSGYIFAPSATSTQTINDVTIYSPISGNATEPIRSTIAHTEQLPSILDFARELKTLGSSVTHIAIRGDEVDQYLVNGTRITYVLGAEQDAFTALVSSKENINLSDGTIDYIDLRFDGKVYLKRK